MANATPSRLGQINGAGDVDALFLKVFAGEVLTAFEETNVTADKHMVRSISNGKSAQFPITGKIGAEYHVPGAEITGGQIAANERVITIDDLLISNAFISNIDEAKNHYDVRSIYSTEIGRALAYTYDKHILQLFIQAARDASPVTGEDGGGLVVAAEGLTDDTGEALIAALFQAAQTLDEKHIPAEDRYAFLNPEAYYLLAQNTKIMNTLWNGVGSYKDANVMKVAGINIVKTNHAPYGKKVLSTEQPLSGTAGKYAVDATNTFGVVSHKMAVGTVKLLDLAMESEYDIRRQGTLMVAKYAMGHGVLRPAAAVELATAAPAA
jgi:hypothetical protein